jgi:hypothetical protein
MSLTCMQNWREEDRATGVVDATEDAAELLLLLLLLSALTPLTLASTRS